MGFSRLRKPLGCWQEIAQLIPGSYKDDAIYSLSYVVNCAHAELIMHATVWVISLPLVKNTRTKFDSHMLHELHFQKCNSIIRTQGTILHLGGCF